MKKIRVLIVDDSLEVRTVLTDILQADVDIEVVGTAPDPYVARDKIKQINPDVLTLDVEMPRMDGITFLKNIMRLRPMPVVMVSSFKSMGGETAMHALELGAVDVVSRTSGDNISGLRECSREIVAKVKAAGNANLSTRAEADARLDDGDKANRVALSTGSFLGEERACGRIVAIGASTGGTEAVRHVLSELPSDSPGIVVTQHIPAAFSGSFAKRLNSHSGLLVKEAEDGDRIVAGRAFVAPGHSHLVVMKEGMHYVCRLSDSAPVNRHRPSVDVLFQSVARSAGPNAIGVLLTGMGSDGAKGMLEMRESGAITIAQDEATSVVWGMPGEAVKQGAADHVLPLQKIGEGVAVRCRAMAKRGLTMRG